MGQTATQSVYLHWMQDSVTTYGITTRGVQNLFKIRSKLCCIKPAQVKIRPAPAWAMEPPADVIYLERMRRILSISSPGRSLVGSN